MSERDREGFENAILKRLEGLDFQKYGEESNYNPALVHALDGLQYSGDNFSVSINGAAMTSDSKYSAETNVGADLSIGAEIWCGTESKIKTVLVQAKRRSKMRIADEKKRLLEQIYKMKKFTSHPKVLVIDEYPGAIPVIQSAAAILAGKSPREFQLHRWLARKFVRTFDGDQSLYLYQAAQSADLNRIWVKAEFEKSKKR